jgi:hypothetical protein
VPEARILAALALAPRSSRRSRLDRAKTATGFALRAGLPWFKKAADQYELAREELRQRTGREPTERELFDHLSQD